MTKKYVLFFSSILLMQLITPMCVFGENCSVKKEIFSSEKKKQNVRIKWIAKYIKRSSSTPIVTGYIEEGQLFISFSTPLNEVCIEVIDNVVGVVIYSGVISGNSLVIPVTSENDDYSIYVLDRVENE